MVKNKKIIVVLPAYNAEKTLEQTFNEIPHDVVDEIVIVDDCSNDSTIEVAKKLGIKHIIKHQKNKGYGGNQKTCYDTALSLGGDIIIMVHPDYQYTPLLIEPMAYVLANGLYAVIFGSRILGRDALKGGMPMYKYIANRILTLIENIMLGEKLTEYHTGYRAYTREVLENINYKANSDDFIFDNQIIAQIFNAGFSIAEISCPTKYFTEASSISFKRSVKYGLGVLKISCQYRLNKWKLKRYNYLKPIK